MGSPTWSHAGIYAVGNAHKDKVKLTFAHGAALPDPKKLFNATLGGGTWRAIRYRLLWNKTLRRLIYPFDLAVFLGYRVYHEVLRGRVLVMDRYFYDTLVGTALEECEAGCNAA